MGYPTKVQLISRKKGADQYYINFPTAVAEAMEFSKGETIEWIIEDKANIIAHRPLVPASPVTVKKNFATLRSVECALGRLRKRGGHNGLLFSTFQGAPIGPSRVPKPSHRHFADHDQRKSVQGLDC